jgi:hypothetical protein
LHVKEIKQNCLIRYEVFDHLEEDSLPPEESDEPRSAGWCFEAADFLFFISQDSADELKLCIVHQNSGMRASKVLWGVLLSTNGVDKSEDPAAAKVALRLLGRTAKEAAANSVVTIAESGDDEKVAEEHLKRRVGGYLDDGRSLQAKIYRSIKESILPCIRNEIPAKATPLALVMKRPKGP